MSKTRSALKSIDANLDESIGVRYQAAQPSLSPVPSSKDAGRKPLRTFGTVNVDLVSPDPNQPRTEFTEESIVRLAESIKRLGQLQPITVRWSAESKKWLIISGERRWRASKAAGMKTINCHFEQRDLGTSELLEQQLVENLLREDLKPIEQARAYTELMALNDWNGKQVADALHISASTVSRSLALLDLPAEVQQKVDAGALSARAAYEISKLPTKRAQNHVANQPAISVANAKAATRRRGKEKQRRGFKQTFVTESGFKVAVSCPRKTNYEEVELALKDALEEVQHLIENRRVAL